MFLWSMMFCSKSSSSDDSGVKGACFVVVVLQKFLLMIEILKVASVSVVHFLASV